MFITTEDYKVVIGESSLTVVTQADSENRHKAEKEAIEEISGYLRPKYDVNVIFAATGADRNSYLVMIACDVALYHLFTSLNAKMGLDTRRERYECAIKWLEGVQKGTIVPNLPIATDEYGEPANPLHYGSEKRHKNTW